MLRANKPCWLLTTVIMIATLANTMLIKPVVVVSVVMVAMAVASRLGGSLQRYGGSVYVGGVYGGC